MGGVGAEFSYGGSGGTVCVVDFLYEQNNHDNVGRYYYDNRRSKHTGVRWNNDHVERSVCRRSSLLGHRYLGKRRGHLCLHHSVSRAVF